MIFRTLHLIIQKDIKHNVFRHETQAERASNATHSITFQRTSYGRPVHMKEHTVFPLRTKHTENCVTTHKKKKTTGETLSTKTDKSFPKVKLTSALTIDTVHSIKEAA